MCLNGNYNYMGQIQNRLTQSFIFKVNGSGEYIKFGV